MGTIKIKIDVSKIDKSRLFKGKQGTYLNAVLIETPNNQYGDSHMIVEDVSKDEREKGVKGNILGNAKTFGGNNQTSVPVTDLPAEGDDLPF